MEWCRGYVVPYMSARRMIGAAIVKCYIQEKELKELE